MNFEYNGSHYSIKGLSKLTKIPYSILYSRLVKLGWSVEKTIKPSSKNLYKGKTIAQHAKDCNMHYTTMHKRLKTMSIEQALSVPLRRIKGVRKPRKSRTRVPTVLEVYLTKRGFNVDNLSSKVKLSITNRAINEHKRESGEFSARIRDVSDDILELVVLEVLGG